MGKIIDQLTGRELTPEQAADIWKQPGRLKTTGGLIMTTSEGASQVTPSLTGRALLPNWVAPVASAIVAITGSMLLGGFATGTLFYVVGALNLIGQLLLGNSAGAREGALKIIDQVFKKSKPDLVPVDPPKPSV